MTDTPATTTPLWTLNELRMQLSRLREELGTDAAMLELIDRILGPDRHKHRAITETLTTARRTAIIDAVAQVQTWLDSPLADPPLEKIRDVCSAAAAYLDAAAQRLNVLSEAGAQQ